MDVYLYYLCFRSKVFGQEVCRVLITVDKEYIHELSFNYFSYVVIADIYVFGPFFSHWVTGDEIEP